MCESLCEKGLLMCLIAVAAKQDATESTNHLPHCQHLRQRPAYSAADDVKAQEGGQVSHDLQS